MAQAWWLEEKVEGWKYFADIMDGVACKHLQAAYAGLKNSLQKEWDFVRHVTLEIGMAFHPIRDALREVFVRVIFKEATSQITGILVTGLPVKKSDIDLPDPTQTAGPKWMASCVITGHLLADIQRTVEFRSGDRALLMEEGRDEIRWKHAERVPS